LEIGLAASKPIVKLAVIKGGGFFETIWAEEL